MNKIMKRVGIALGVCLVAALALRVAAQITTTEADKQALRQIKVAYEDAVNRDDMQALAPHLAANFSAVMATGQKVTNHAEFVAYWNTMKQLVGIGPKLHGKYTAALEPLDSIFLGGYAFSFGTAKETLVTDVAGPNGRVSNNYAFNSNWYAVSEKDNGVWKLVAARVVVDPFRTTFSDAKIQEIAAASTPAMKRAGLTQ